MNFIATTNLHHTCSDLYTSSSRPSSIYFISRPTSYSIRQVLNRKRNRIRSFIIWGKKYDLVYQPRSKYTYKSPRSTPDALTENETVRCATASWDSVGSRVVSTFAPPQRASTILECHRILECSQNAPLFARQYASIARCFENATRMGVIPAHSGMLPVRIPRAFWNARWINPSPLRLLGTHPIPVLAYTNAKTKSFVFPSFLVCYGQLGQHQC